MVSQEEKQFLKMTQKPVKRLISTLAIPTICSMLITSIYNMADTYFVSHLGQDASGAVGIVFSLMAIIQAFGFTVGMGSGSLISRLLGARQLDKANETAISGLVTGICLGLFFAIFGTMFITPLMKLLGATDEILPHAEKYAFYILLASPVNICAFILNNILRSEGKAIFSLIGISVGGILNCFLDPLFIYTFGLGTSGAAIASATGQFVSFCILISTFLRDKTVVHLSLRNISRKARVYTDILKNGLPSMSRQGLSSASTVCLNWSAKLVGGTAAIAAMSIVTKVFMFMFSVLIGFGQGYQPVVGYNFSARKNARVREAFKFMYSVSTIISLTVAVLIFIFAEAVVGFFIGNDVEVIAIGTLALRAQCVVLPFMPLNVVCNMTFQAIGKPSFSVLTSSLRQGLLFIPLILILPRFLGLLGVQLTQPIADGIAFLISIPFALYFMRRIKKLEK